MNLPSAYAGFYNTGFKPSNFTTQEGTLFTIDANKLIEEVQDNGLSFQAGFKAESFGLALNFNKFFIQAYHGVRGYNNFTIPEETFDFLFNGNGHFVGETLGLGMEFNSLVYSELGLGLGIKINDKLNVGVKLKYLSGLTTIQTAKSDLEIYTDPEYYQLKFNTDYMINTGGLTESALVSENRTDYLFGPNNGFAFDIGALFKVNKKFTLGASLINVGSIKWEEHLNSYQSSGEFQYDGIELNAFIEDDVIDFDEVVDSLNASFEVLEVSREFNTRTPVSFNITGSYEFAKRLYVGALYAYQDQFNKDVHAVAINLRKDLGSVFSIGTQYAFLGGTAHNIGLTTVLKVGPLQLYFIADNVLPIFNPLTTQHFNTRVGLNLVVGFTDKRNEKKLAKKEEKKARKAFEKGN